MSTANNTQKDTIYVDVDDEITAIIDKVTSSNNKIIALVLPKRAVVLQSIVNMKLLKRTADDAKKHLVLITSESGLLPLAGITGLHVAKSLQSKPTVPMAPGNFDEAPEDVGDALAEQESIEDFDPSESKSRSIGDLAESRSAAELQDDTIEIDDIEDDANTDAADKKALVPKKDKKLAVPNFNKFRLWIILGCSAVVLLIVGSIFAFNVLPKATVVVSTDSRDITVNKTVTASVSQTTLDKTKLILPAKSVEQQKTETQKVDATGQKNVGTKATGTVRIYNCNKDDTLAGNDYTVPAGTGISLNGKTYITQASVTVEPSTYGSGGSVCNKNKLSNPIGITAITAGEQANAAAADGYSVAGFSSMSGRASATTGGTDQIVKVISQTDVDGVKAKLTAVDTAPVVVSLKNNLTAEGWQAVTATFVGGDPQITTSANVGDEADSVSVTQTITYSMLGIKQADLKTIIQEDVTAQLKDDTQQNLQKDGVDKARFTVATSQDPKNIQLAVVVTATVGPELSEQEVQKIAAGKKLGDIKNELEKIEGVEKVSVEYSHFWVSKVPSNQSKITVIFEKSGQ